MLIGEPIAQLVLEVALILPIIEVKTLPTSARDPTALAAMIEMGELQEFQEKFELLVEAFHNTILTQGQDVCFTNLSDIQNSHTLWEVTQEADRDHTLSLPGLSLPVSA